MAYAYFDNKYAPAGFLIVPDDGDPYGKDTVLIDSDWDFPSVAQSMGWNLSSVQKDGGSCPHGGTDGTVACPKCGVTPSEFISSAYDYIREHAEENFPELDEYLRDRGTNMTASKKASGAKYNIIECWSNWDSKQEKVVDTADSAEEALEKTKALNDARKGSVFFVARPQEKGVNNEEYDPTPGRNFQGIHASLSNDNLDEFTRAYIEAALWSSDDDNNVPLDKNYDIGDIAPSTLQVIVNDCKKFQQENGALIRDSNRPTGQYSLEAQAGHDFWLTRNGHGAGFWDGDWPETGDELTEASKKFGEVDLYVGDDGFIYQSPETSKTASDKSTILAETLSKSASILCEDDRPNIDVSLQVAVGDPNDTRSSAFVQFNPNPGTMQLPNPLSPVQGDEMFFAYLIPGAIFQAKDGSEWWIESYTAPDEIEITNRWYPRVNAIVSINDIRRSIHQWVEPVTQTVPPAPPGVSYGALPVRIVNDDEGETPVGETNISSSLTGGW